MFLNRIRDQADARLHRALNPAVVVLTDGGRVAYYSPGAEALFGLPADRLARVGFGQCIPCPKEYRGDILAYLKDYADNAVNIWQQPLTAYRYDGVRFPVVYRMIGLAEGRDGWLCEFMDASAEHVVHQRLNQALEENRSSSRAKSRFLSHMTQQFRLPLNRLLGTITDALDIKGLPRDMQDNLEHALQSGRELQRNLNEMVDFTRLETEQLEFHNISFNFRLVLEEIVDSFADVARRKGIELATLVSPYVPESVVGDPDRLRQVLQSLLNNACRFTNEGGITVKAECQIENAQHAVIELEIADTGEGMSEEKAQMIRTAFEKRDSAFTDRYGGLGIGLAISRELLNLMGGTLTLRSVEGLGTSFKLTLKMAKGEELITSQQPLARRHLLLVTDSPQERGKLMEYFNDWQLDVECQGSSPLALERLRQASLSVRPFELVLIDLQRQKLAGIQLVQEINRNTAFNDVRILLLQEDQEYVNLITGGELKLDAVLVKPVRKQSLHDAVAAVLGRSSSALQPLVTDRSLRDSQVQTLQRALLVDDNEVNQIIAKGALKKLGIHADVTTNGEEAVEAVTEKRYDFVLMDCDMPIMDGFEATRSIRAWEREMGGHLPIIALTSSDAQDCHDACMDAGMDDYMQKPFRADQLHAILQRVRTKLN